MSAVAFSPRDPTTLRLAANLERQRIGEQYKIVNRKSGKVLDIAAGSTADAAAAVQSTAGTGTNQQWTFTFVKP